MQLLQDCLLVQCVLWICFCYGRITMSINNPLNMVAKTHEVSLEIVYLISIFHFGNLFALALFGSLELSCHALRFPGNQFTHNSVFTSISLLGQSNCYLKVNYLHSVEDSSGSFILTFFLPLCSNGYLFCI